MFLTKQTKETTPPTPEFDGIEIQVRLSGATLIKLITLIIAILVGSGVLAPTQTPSPAELPSDLSETTR